MVRNFFPRKKVRISDFSISPNDHFVKISRPRNILRTQNLCVGHFKCSLDILFCFYLGGNFQTNFWKQIILVFYRGTDGTYLISKGEKVGESDLINNNRRIGTMQTQSQEVQLVSLHKEWYEMIIYEQNQKGNIKI